MHHIRLLALRHSSHLHAFTVMLPLLVAFCVTGSAGIALAGTLTSSSVTLNDTTPSGTNVEYDFDFTVESSTVLHAFSAQVCTTPDGVCITPSGFSAGSAVMTNQPTGYGDSSGWADDSTTGAFRTNNLANASAPSGTQQIDFTNAGNPSGSGPYYVRITTYSDSSYSTVVDSVTVPFVIVSGVRVGLIVQPTLSFDVAGVPASTVYKGALSTSANCVDTPNSITYDTNPAPLNPDTNYDCAQTLTTSTDNATGYEVTVYSPASGNTLANTSNSSTIANWTGTNASPSATPASTELFGYTTNNALLNGTANRFTVADNRFAGLTQTAEEVVQADNAVANDAYNVGYRLQFTTASQGGTYAGQVVYTCTPTF
jgi:hypothetical protein